HSFMRIDGIVLRELQMPLVRPFETSFGVTRNRRIVLAEVQSEGLIGWGEVHETIPCGVSLGIHASIPELMATIERELAAGYQRIKLKCKLGWDVEVFEHVRNRWPEIMLSCDANSAYKLKDEDHLVEFDDFDLLMIEQPL